MGFVGKTCTEDSGSLASGSLASGSLRCLLTGFHIPLVAEVRETAIVDFTEL
jgi:hypothetical protein